MRAASKVKMSGSEKNVNRNTSNKNFWEYIRHFLHNMCNQEVSHCNNNSKEMYKRVCCMGKVLDCYLIRPIFLAVFFFHHRLALHNFVF